MVKRRNRNVRRREKANISRALETLHEQKQNERLTGFMSSHKLVIAVLIGIGLLYALLRKRRMGGSLLRELAMLKGDRP